MNEATKAIAQALLRKNGFQVVSYTETPSQIRLVGRIPKESARNWILARHSLLNAAETTPWNLDSSRQDLLRDGELRWAWRLIFQHEDIASQISSILTAINSVPKARVELTSQPLPGVKGPRRMMSDTGKGAARTGTLPLILQGQR